MKNLRCQGTCEVQGEARRVYASAWGVTLPHACYRAKEKEGLSGEDGKKEEGMDVREGEECEGGGRRDDVSEEKERLRM